MKTQSELLKYLIDEMNRRHSENVQRFDKVEEKLDTLINFRVAIIGGATAAGMIGSFIVTVIFNFVK